LPRSIARTTGASPRLAIGSWARRSDSGSSTFSRSEAARGAWRLLSQKAKNQRRKNLPTNASQALMQ
jgi:hypothetical protein